MCINLILFLRDIEHTNERGERIIGKGGKKQRYYWTLLMRSNHSVHDFMVIGNDDKANGVVLKGVYRVEGGR